MNNSYFGKTCEDVRKYKDVKICTSKEDIEKLSKKEKYDGWTIYNSNLAAVLLKKNHVTLNKPRYIGTAVLGMSKEIMYDFHYNYMMKDYPNAKLLFSDTTILKLIEIFTKISREINGMISAIMLRFILIGMIVNNSLGDFSWNSLD